MKKKFFSLLVFLATLLTVLPCFAADEQKAFKTLNDFSGARFSTYSGSTAVYHTQNAIPNANNFVYYSTIADAIVALKSNKVDAFVCDDPVARLAVSKNPELRVFPEPIYPDNYGFAFPKNSPLTPQFNKIIQKFASDGTLQKLKDIWLGSDETKKILPKQDWSGKNGTIRCFHDYTSEPIIYVGSDGPLGYEMDVLLRIAKELDMKVELTMCEFDGLLAALQSGKADVICGCMSIMPERKNVVDFSDPHYKAALVLLVRNETYVAPKENFFDSIMASFNRTFIVENRWKLILDGLWVTILISACAGVGGLLLGFILCMLKRKGSKTLRQIVSTFIRLIQGTPIVVFLMILYFIVFGSVNIAPLPIAILGFTINFGVYAAEIYNSGLDTVDNGQREAALALGYTPKQTFWKVIFPQAAQHFLPILKGEFISMVKTTSVVGYISVQDLTMVTDIIHARTMEAFFPLIVTAAIYLIIANLLTSFLDLIEIKINPKHSKRTVKGVKMQ